MGTQEHLDRAHENGHKVFADLLRFVDDVIVPRLRQEGTSLQTEQTALMWGAAMVTAILNNRAVSAGKAPIVAVHVTSMMAAHCAEGVWPAVEAGEMPVGFFRPAFFTEARSLAQGAEVPPAQEQIAKQITDDLFATIAAENRAAREARAPAPVLTLRQRYRRSQERKNRKEG